MHWTFVFNAVRMRRGRLGVAFAAMTVAAALATALFSLYSDVERKIRAQFQTYGANLLIVPNGSAVTVPSRAAPEARRLGAAAAPFLYSVNEIDGQPVVLAGVDFVNGASLTQYWHIEGSGECLAGVSLSLKIGENARLKNFSCVVTGVLSTGGAEDNQIVLPFDTVARLSGVAEAASLVQVRAPGKELDAVRQSLQSSLPGTDVRLVRAVAETEANVVVKMRMALSLLTAIVLVITIISVTSNFGELVLEREKEIGILKAIGAGERKIAALFLSESLILAVCSTLAGYFVGVVIAAWIDRSVFSGAFSLHPDPMVLLLAALVTLAIAIVATCLAAGSIWRVQPAAVLRGE